MRRIFAALRVALVVGLAVSWWTRNRRFGTEFVNRVVNPALMRRRWAGGKRSEIGTLEHVGRRSGTLRRTPVHPEPEAEGFRVIVPLGSESQWARNVLAAGHCRLQLHDTVYELDEPRLISPEEVEALPPIVRQVEGLLGFRYLRLRTFGSMPGDLDAAPVTEPQAEVEAEGHPLAEALVPEGHEEAVAVAGPARPVRRERKASTHSRGVSSVEGV